MNNKNKNSSGKMGPGEGDDVDLLAEQDVEDHDFRGVKAKKSDMQLEEMRRSSFNGEDEKRVEETAEKSETRVGKKLSDMTTRRVIVLVLIMLLVMPQFSPSSWGVDEYLLSSNY